MTETEIKISFSVYNFMKEHFSNKKVKVTMLNDEEWEKITKKLAKSNHDRVKSTPK